VGRCATSPTKTPIENAEFQKQVLFRLSYRCVCVRVGVYVREWVGGWVSVRMCVCVCVCVAHRAGVPHTASHTYTHTHTHTHTHAHTHTQTRAHCNAPQHNAAYCNTLQRTGKSDMLHITAGNSSVHTHTRT